MLDTEFIAATEKSSRRLMIVLHGLGDSMEGYRWWPEAMQLPWLNYLLVNAPDPYYGGFAWYDLQDPGAGNRTQPHVACSSCWTNSAQRFSG